MMTGTRKFAILAVACALLMPAEAVRVTSEQAAVAARNWLRGGYGLERRMGTAIESVRTLAGTNGAACHVAAVEGGGFVVLGSDTEDSPVIAVSAQGRVDPDERNPLWALLRQDMAARARARAEKRTAAGARWAKLLGRDLAQDSSPASRKLLSASNGRATIADVRVDALVKSAWSQTDFRNFGYVSDDVVCYNYYTPNHWPCGCVATAGAQVMRYHNHPTASVAAGTYDCKVAESPTPLTMKGGTYDWKVMTLVPANGCSAESREAIGKLTYDVGVSVGMSYGEKGSNAAGYLLTKRFVDRFQYANAASVIFDKKLQCPYSLDRLKAVVIPNLDAGLPVVLGISGAGGHVVVGDGYGYSDGEFFVHINLGWANLDDGNVWYRPPDIDNYTSIDSIVYNVYPTGEAGTSIVSGRILNSGGLPVKGATVRALVGGRQVSAVTSDSKGIYALKVSPGTCRIEAEKDGLVAGRNITVAACVSPRIEDSGIYWDDVKPQIGNVCDNDLTLEVSDDPDPGPQDEMDLAVGGPGLKWTTGEDYPWTISTGDFTPGGTCLCSDGSVTNKHGASSWLKTTVTGPVELGFRYAKTLYRCPFTVECDGVALYRDEEEAYRSDLKLAMVNVPAGEHEIVFRFTFNGGRYSDFNGIWLDEVAIDRYAHAPTFSPATTASETTSLKFADSLQVTLAADSGATIHYTTDGTTPDTSSPVYRTPIVLTQTTLLRAIAERPGKEPSPVAEALYRLAKPVGPGEWTADVEAVRAAAATGGNLVAVLYADLATCWYSQQFDLQAGDAEFLAWAKANGVYLVSADQSRYPWAKAALDWFSSAHRGLTYLPTIVFFNAWAQDECIGEGVFRNGETVNGRVYQSTVASLEECFASFLTERPAPAPETYAITYDLDGGANASANPESYSADDLPITLEAPTRNGYDFTGWLPGGEIAVGTTGDLTFTATWKKQEEPELPTQSEEMDRAVGGPGLQWTTGANFPWAISTDDFTPGGVCLRSDGSVTNKNGNSSWLKTTVTGPVELWFRYAKTLYLCPFTVECDGKTLYRDEEEGWRTAWRTEMVNVPAGKHKIVFRFTYKGGVYLDFNGIWLDEVAIDRYAHAPTFSPATTASETTSLKFTGSQQVTLAADSGATIHYTTDGSTPVTSSPVYRDPIVLRQTTLLRAIAVKPGKEPSPVAEALYRLAKPVGPGEWTTDVEAVRAAAATNGNMIAVLYADVGSCWYSQQLDLQAGSAEFLAWAKANGVYLVSADQSRYPWAKAALDWFYLAHSGPTYLPTIVFFNAWEPDVGIGEGVFRNGETVNGHVYQSTVTSLEECFASFLSERPGPSAPATYAITYDLAGGVNAVENPTSYTTNDLPIVLSEPTKEGYDFKGWTLDGKTVTEIAKGTTGDLALTAAWEKAGGDHPEITPGDQPYYSKEGAWYAIRQKAVTDPGPGTILEWEVAEHVVSDSGLASSHPVADKGWYDIYRDGVKIDTVFGVIGYRDLGAKAGEVHAYVVYGYFGTGVVTEAREVRCPMNYSLSVSPTNVTAIAEGGEADISVRSLKDEWSNRLWADQPASWKAKTDSKWITLVNDAGNGESVLKIRVATNDSEVARSAVVTVAPGGVWELAEKVFVVQEARSEEPTPDEPTVYAIEYDLAGGVNAEANPTSYTTNDLPIVLSEPTREGYDFAGWTPSGEIAVGTTGDLTFTAAWTEHAEPPIPPPDPKRLVDGLTEADKDAFPATTYDGYLYDDQVGDVWGTIQVKAAKAKFNKNTGKMTTKLTVGIQLADGSKKVSISGEYDLDAGGVQSFTAKGRTVSLTMGANGMAGTFEGCAIEGVPNVFALKDAKSMQKAKDADARYVGSYNVFAAEGAFTVTVAKKGKVKLSGALFDGTKVSASAQLLVGDGSACIPFVAAKQKLAFAVWFGAEKEMSVVGLEDAIVGPGANMNIVGQDNAFQVDVEGLSDVMTKNGIEPLAEFMPQGLPVVPNGKKWLVANGAKAGKIKYDAASGEVWDDKESANPSGLALSYSAKAGTFTGSFKVYGIVGGKLKSYTAKVTGVLVDGRGYGFASISKVGGAAVRID